MKSLFQPKSIAVVGASKDEGKIGHIILRNLISSGFEGALYPINPKAPDVLGLKAYPSLESVPDTIELAIIAVPNTFVPAIMEDAGQKGVKAVIIITAGFKEMGHEGADLENQVGAIGKKYGIRILGPNCMGIINPHHRMNATFTNIFPRAGPIAITSQSGAVCSSILDWSSKTKLGFSKFVSVGNKVDIDEAEIISYLEDDDLTKVIAMYIEGTNRGKEFMDRAARTSKVKPILALKSGRTSSGSKAASSHTGALSGSDKVYDAAMRQAGVVRVKTIDEMFDLLQVFANMPLPKGDGLAIVTNAGGLGVMAADACADHGLTLSTFSKETIEKLRSGLPEESNIYNPVDVLGDATAERYEFAMRTVMEDEKVSCMAVLLAPLDTVDIPAVANLVSSFSGKVEKPVVAAFTGGLKTSKGIDILRESGIPNYDSPDRAIRALGAMVSYKERRDAIAYGEPPLFLEADEEAVKRIILHAREQNRVSLSEAEGKGILGAYEIPRPREEEAKTADEAVKLAQDIGYPVVMKISSPDIAHKSDVGGVVLGVNSDNAVRMNFDLMMSRVRARMPRARIHGVSIQQMVSGREVIVGMVRDAQFGPVITFGLGGIFVEIMKDVTQSIAPLSGQHVDEMIRSIKSYPILTGARGRKPADIAALKKTILQISQIAIDFPEISELEVNPVMVGDEGQGCYAVDALVTIKREST